MAISGRLSGTAVPAPTAGVISDSRGGTLTATFTGVQPGQLPVYVALGAGTAPIEAYQDVTGDVGGAPLPSEGSLTYTYRLGTDTYDVVVKVFVPDGHFTLADDLFAALFVNKSVQPDPTDVPDAVAGPIVVAA